MRLQSSCIFNFRLVTSQFGPISSQVRNRRGFIYFFFFKEQFQSGFRAVSMQLSHEFPVISNAVAGLLAQFQSNIRLLWLQFGSNIRSLSLVPDQFQPKYQSSFHAISEQFRICLLSAGSMHLASSFTALLALVVAKQAATEDWIQVTTAKMHHLSSESSKV